MKTATKSAHEKCQKLQRLVCLLSEQYPILILSIRLTIGLVPPGRRRYTYNCMVRVGLSGRKIVADTNAETIPPIN